MNESLAAFLKELMKRRERLPSQLAADLGISHATVSRWLHGKDTPSPQSCRKLARYAGLPVEKVLAIAGHLPPEHEKSPAEWPEFREYARRKYPELDDALVSVIAYLIEHGRRRVAPVPSPR